MAWINLHRLNSLLCQRGIDDRRVTVFVDDPVINPRYRRPLLEEATPEYDDGMPEDEPVEY